MEQLTECQNRIVNAQHTGNNGNTPNNNNSSHLTNQQKQLEWKRWDQQRNGMSVVQRPTSINRTII